MIVVDASIVLKIFMDDLKDNEIERKLEISDGLIAPQIIDVEVINGIRKNRKLGNIRYYGANATRNKPLAHLTKVHEHLCHTSAKRKASRDCWPDYLA